MNPMNPHEPQVPKGSFFKTAGRDGGEMVCMNLMNLFSQCKEKRGIRGYTPGYTPKRFIGFIPSSIPTLSRGFQMNPSFAGVHGGCKGSSPEPLVFASRQRAGAKAARKSPRIPTDSARKFTIPQPH